jgi:predicted ester cyclase
MSVEENKAFVQGNVDALDELCAPNFHLEVLGRVEAFKEASRRFRTSFLDLHFTIEEIIAEGDKVAYRWTARGTHQG